MIRSSAVWLLVIVAWYCHASACLADSRPDRPNVILLLTDDLGWQDVKCYDLDEPAPTETPNLDALSKRGVMFWQAYSPAPTCAPTRCAIMSGNHPARAQKTHVIGGAPPVGRNRHARMMDPWYSGRMPANELTIARVLQQNGYTTGHVGKWHMAIQHHAFPQPEDQGFDFTRSDRGAHAARKDRMSGFATPAEGDPYRLDENGFPFHQNSEDAIDFVRQSKSEPFFLYYATWLVHAPIHTRSKTLLDKYAGRVMVDPRNVFGRDTPGQINPHYLAMVEMLDYYVGQLIDYLDTTEDPRWPGHRLMENTYIILTSDNGGMEGPAEERYTDNNPLDLGKISAKEGGTRVPLLICGPGISRGIQSDVMVNGLDFYPTILAWAGVSTTEAKHLDGCDLSELLSGDPTDPTLVRHPNGSIRDTMVWHFPHGIALESTIRIGDYKLIRNYDHRLNKSTPELELFRLYDSTSGIAVRVDIEESDNLAEKYPEKTLEMNRDLTRRLTEMDASYPYYHPNCVADLPGKESVCSVHSHQVSGNHVTFQFQENGARVVRADLIYTLNGGERYEEWFRATASLRSSGIVEAELPAKTTHYVLNLIDENQFLVSYPLIQPTGRFYSQQAISVSDHQVKSDATPGIGKRSGLFIKIDGNQDGKLTADEYVGHFQLGFARKDSDRNGVLTEQEHNHPSFQFADQDNNGELVLDEFRSIFRRQFDGLDKDKSGFLTPGEMKR